MKHPIENNREDDGDVCGWIAEAGDPRVEPRPEHVEHVREVLLERLAFPPRRDGRRWLVLGRLTIAAAGMLLVGLVGSVLFLARPGNAWARITQSVQEKRWIHGVTRAGDAVISESWASPRYEIFAVKYVHDPDQRGVEYHDLKAGIKTMYVASENTIYRVAEDSGSLEHHLRGNDFFRQFLHAGQLETAPIPGTEIVDQTSRDVTEKGKTWKQHEVTVRWKEGRKSVVRMVIRVDPATGLPRTWDMVSPEETLHSTLDYPETGPGDILALGVPATARRVDRVPGDDLNRALNGLKVGRNRFDDYCGYTWFEGVNSANVRRIWRKGRKWRVDDVQRLVTTKAEFHQADVFPNRIPIGVDLGFWKVHEAEVVFVPMAACDGQTIRFYRYKARDIVPDQPYVAELQSVTEQSVYGGADDPMMPWPHLLPEQQAHPNIFGATPDREFSIEPRPADGPRGTIRISVRDARSQDAMRPDLNRLWIDPEKNHLAMRAEASVFDSAGPKSKDGMPTKMAFLDTQILTDLDRSPGGFWYPTRVVRKTSNFPGEQVTRFVLDFQAEIPDALFRPAE
jgi:hypothetical protein